MADQSELENLAKNYLELWQEHLNSVGKDENLADLMAKSLSMMNSGAATFANAVAEAAQSAETSETNEPDRQSDHAETNSPANSPPPSERTTPAELPSGHTDPHMDQLFRRIAALEERIAELEQDSKPKRPSKVRARKRSEGASPKV